MFKDIWDELDFSQRKLITILVEFSNGNCIRKNPSLPNVNGYTNFHKSSPSSMRKMINVHTFNNNLKISSIYFLTRKKEK